jgi:hypothetical protein
VLLQLLAPEYDDKSNSKHLAIEFLDNEFPERDKDDQKPSAQGEFGNNQTAQSNLLNDNLRSPSPLNLKKAWMLQDYSILEYILYYVCFNQTIKKQSGYFRYNI